MPTLTRERAPADPERRGDVAQLAGPVILVCSAIFAAIVGREILLTWQGNGPVATWTTVFVFVSVTVQALPFLGLGVLLSACVTAFVPPRVWSKAMPTHPAAAVPVGVLARVLLPGYECASVPVADRLIRQGVTPAAAIAFLLSAPAINPAVLAATAVAFPHRPAMVFARLAASSVTALVVGLFWTTRTHTVRPPVAARAQAAAGNRWETFRLGAQHDLFQGGGFLVVGAALSATANVLVPPSFIEAASGVPVISVLVLGLLAVVLCICSEADAFVASSLATFPAAAQLAFMVVGPAVDLKLITMQAGTFGRGFVLRTAPLAWSVAVLSSLAAATWIVR